ncbi:amidohydrolase [Microbacterium sp. B2969]|uniref:Amidohydrolase n=1 Tax=Microbacterium alkaliflavum TaxID=3248839 RepID=A0ABW7Q2T8_9MICO
MTDESIARARRWRRDLHQCPGIAFDVRETAEYLARVLGGLGWDVQRGIGGHGLVASLNRGSSSRAIALRSDMDGLPIEESTGVEYSSRNAGAMHACGHDGHMAILLGTADALRADPSFDGTVHLIFQPAEEPGRGALAMIADGLFDRFPIDAIYGLHNLPGIPAGHIHTRAGAIMAAEDNFEIRIHGRGGHASMPHLVVDPLVIGADVVTSLQTIVARTVDASHSVVVSCTEFITDGARNAIPGEVIIRGDTRTFTAEDSQIVEQRIRTLAEGLVHAHGATCDIDYTREFRPTVNDETLNEVLARAAAAALGNSAVDAACAPRMASEDFGEFARVVPGCFAFLGTGTVVGRGGTPLHSRDYDFNDDVLSAGIAFYLELIRTELAEAD